MRGYNQGKNIWDFRENPWNFEATNDLLSSIRSLRMEEFQQASFQPRLETLDLCILALKGLKCFFNLRDNA